jgi:outer membrane protein
MRPALMRPILLALLLAWRSGVDAADLLDIYRQAAAADATYAAARNTWSAAQERIPQARANLLPLAAVSASSQYNDRQIRFREPTIPRADSEFGSSALSLTVTQPVFRMQNTIAYEQALTQTEQADAQFALAAQDLILRAAQAYFDVLLAQDNIVLAEAQKAAIGQQLAQAKRNFDVGTATITDTHEAQARYDLTVAQEIAARSELELRRRALEQVIAGKAPPLAPLGPAFVLKVPPAAMDSWVSLARASNLQVRVAHHAAAFASQDIARNRAGRYPTVDVFATLSDAHAGAGVVTGTTAGVSNNTRTAVLGVQLAVPLYQGGAVNSRVREAIANHARAGDELEAARRAAEFSARQAYLGITNGVAQVQALEAALVSTQSQLDSTVLGQDVGVRTQVDVLNAQQLLYSARRDLAQAKYNYVLATLRLEAAIGELTEQDVAAVNQWLDKSSFGAAPDARAVSVPASYSTISVEPLAPAKPEARAVKPEGDRDEVVRAVEGWAHAWGSNDVEGYLAYYLSEFEPPRGLTRSAWEAERAARIRKPRRIEIEIEAPEVSFDAEDRATVTFRQLYRSGALNLSSEKMLTMVKRGGEWRIEAERLRSETRSAAAAHERRR